MLTLAIAILLSSVISFSCQKEGSWSRAKQTAAAPPTGPVTHPPPPKPLVWVRLTDLPFLDLIPNDVPLALINPQGFAINGKGYLCGGQTIPASGQPEELNNLWEYDTAAKFWALKAHFPGGTTLGATNFVVGSAAYILTGNATWQYDQPTDTWTRKADLPGDSRSAASAFTIGSNGYAGFGFDMTTHAGVLNDFYRYEPATDRWSRMPAFPGSARGGAMSFAVDSYGYICSGLDYVPGSPLPFLYLADLWQFDPGTGTWASKQVFPGNAGAYGVGLGGLGHGFVGAGSDGSNNQVYYKDFYEYTPFTDAWIRLPDIGITRSLSGSFFTGNNLYVAGGQQGFNGLKDFWTLRL